MEKVALQAMKGDKHWTGEWDSGDTEHVWAVICGDEGGCKWARLVVGWEWLHPHAGNAGCRSDDGGDMVGARG